jgi:nitrite reductase (NADH) small subunit
MPKWIAVAEAAEIPDCGGKELMAGDKLVAVFRVGDEFFALDAICPHQGGPLAKGTIAGCIVTCPWHGWQFDLKTGQQQIIRTIRQPTYPVKVENGNVWIDLAGELKAEEE